MIRTRFAPSPTGQIHVGNMRVAIFNWLFARHGGGEFLLRIEDTDKERSTPEAVEAILGAMEWLRLDFDGEPVYQSGRAGEHVQTARKLMIRGCAYEKPDGSMWFRVPLADMPEIKDGGKTELKVAWARVTENEFELEVIQNGLKTPWRIPLGAARDARILSEEGETLFDMNRPSESNALPLVIPDARSMVYTRRVMTFHDEIKGDMSKPLDMMKDFAIVRSDKTPIFHLANVADDIWQGVTHVIRGEDHVDNTFKHIMIFRALGARPPAYAHLPMIVNAEGKPYSKRDGAAYIGDFKTMGFVPDAMLNSLALLGWSPKGQEFRPRDALVKEFDLSRCHRSPARMDLAKMRKFNGRHIAEMSLDAFIAEVRPWATIHGWDEDEDYFRKVCGLMQSRTKSLDDLSDWRGFFVENIDSLYEREIFSKEIRPYATELAELANALEKTDFGPEQIAAAVHETENRFGMRPWGLNKPMRYALVASQTGADIVGIMTTLGRGRSLQRLGQFMDGGEK